jgi:general secretion pathway protein D
MNVHDQTLPEILDRVARQVDMRYEMQGKNLSIQPDLPFLKHYRVDYPNIQRDSKGSIGTSTNFSGSGGGSAGGNASSSSIEDVSNNRFWPTLIENLKKLLLETDKLIPDEKANADAKPTSAETAKAASSPVAAAAAVLGMVKNGSPGTSSNDAPSAPQAAALLPRVTVREAASVIANPETGNISVRATQSQHAKVRDFLDQVLHSARRQVLIEATIVEVDLSNQFQQGINWSLLQTKGKSAITGINIAPSGDATTLQTGGAVGSLATLTFKQAGLWNGAADLTGMLSLLESFGTLKVLSSPKISVLNNQSSVLKVVDNKIYFTISYTPGTAATAFSPGTPGAYTSTAHSSPIGFFMTVVPQISDSGEVTLNLRPTITRITGYVADPNPVLSQNNLVNRFPEVQTREMESVLRVQSGDIAVLGGLMQDTRANYSDEVPGVNRIPFVGELFKYRNERSSKSELVIFIRPTVLKAANLDGEFKDFRSLLTSSVGTLGGRESERGSSTAAAPF